MIELAAIALAAAAGRTISVLILHEVCVWIRAKAYNDDPNDNRQNRKALRRQV